MTSSTKLEVHTTHLSAASAGPTKPGPWHASSQGNDL